MSESELTGAALAATVAGALEVELRTDGVRPWRLPASSRRHAAPALALMSEFTAGVRLRFRTTAARLRVEASVERLVELNRDAPTTAATFVAVAVAEDPAADPAEGPAEDTVLDRVEFTETGLVRERPDRGFTRGESPRSTIELALGSPTAKPRLVELWLPQDAAVLLHRITADGPLLPAEPDHRPRWLHYGSSISHGGSADGPLGTWPRLAAAALELDGVNLGFGGNAMLDPDVARAIAGAEADVITLKVGINIVGADSMRRITLLPALHGFLDLIREQRPTTPIALVTAIACPAVESTPGPIRAGADGRAVGTPRVTREGDGTLTLEAIRAAVAEVHADRTADDPALHLADGLALLGVDEERLLPDGLHPGPEGHRVIAERFTALARDHRTALGAAFAAALLRTPAG